MAIETLLEGPCQNLDLKRDVTDQLKDSQTHKDSKRNDIVKTVLLEKRA